MLTITCAVLLDNFQNLLYSLDNIMLLWDTGKLQALGIRHGNIHPSYTHYRRLQIVEGRTCGKGSIQVMSWNFLSGLWTAVYYLKKNGSDSTNAQILFSKNFLAFIMFYFILIYIVHIYMMIHFGCQIEKLGPGDGNKRS